MKKKTRCQACNKQFRKRKAPRFLMDGRPIHDSCAKGVVDVILRGFKKLNGGMNNNAFKWDSEQCSPVLHMRKDWFGLDSLAMCNTKEPIFTLALVWEYVTCKDCLKKKKRYARSK